ncbi:hypothetical protein NPJ82_09305 [Sphingomonas sp. NY01]|uniref:hypothetical protein n=1 Tax=Sphingomonas sp. NY01 TaxID=2968057 RepID=UPI00315D41D6
MGSHRWADPSDTAAFDAARATWEYTTSPGLLALRNALGTWERDEPTGGRYRKVFGAGIPIDGLIVEDFVHLANVCDANGWHVGGRIFEPGNRWDNLKRILAAGGAEPAWRCGRLGVKVQAPRIALDTITANDLADDGDVVVGAMQGWEQRLNTLTPKYRSEAHRWEYVPANAIQITSYLAEDGEEKSEERQIDLVQDATQARQLCAYELMDRRELGEIELPCKPRLRRYGPGDLLIVDIPEAGLVAQPAVVLRRSLNPETMGVSLVLRGETLEKHAFALAATGEAPPTPGLRSTEDIDATLSSTNLIDWSQVRDPDGTRPDDNATNSADPDSPFGPDGTVKEAIATLKRIEPIASDVSALEMAKVEHDDALALLDGVQVDMAAIQRQAERDAGKLDEAMLRLLAESSRTRDVLRDAGIVVAPATGVVRIYAVDQVAERTSRVEVGLDSVRGTVALKADSDWVNNQIALAVLNPEQAAQLEPIIRRLASVEVVADGLLGTITSKANAVDLTATTKRVTTAEQSIDTLTGAITQKVDRTTFDALGETVQSIEQKLDTEGDRTGFSLNIRQARLVADDAATAALRGLLASDGANRRQIVQAAEIRQDIYTRIKDGELTLAKERLELVAEVDAVRAMTVRETTAIVDALGVAARDIRTLAVTTDKQAGAIGEVSEAVIDAKGGLARNGTTIRQVVGRADTADEALLRAIIAGDDASRVRQAQIVQIQTELSTTLVANEVASATARQSLLARMNQAEAAIVEVQSVLTNNIQSLVERVRASEAAWTDKDTGLVATRARLAVEEKLSADRHKANAESIETLSSTVNDPVTGLPAAFATIGRVRETAANENAATAKLVEQVRAEIAGIGDVGLEQAFDAVVNRLGKIEGRYALTIDANGNLTGFEIIGSDTGRGTFNAINVDLRMGTGLIIWNNGQFMEVKGIGFGQNRDLLSWYGPTMAIDACSRANGLEWKGTDGLIYTAAAIKAGPYVNSGTSTLIAADASFTLGPFTSNGKSKAVVASYTFRRNRQIAPGGGGSASGAPSATLVLEYQSGPGIWSQVGTIQTGNPVVTVAPATGEDPGFLEESMSGSITWTDTRTMLDGYLYRLRLTARQQASFTGTAQGADSVTQSLSIISQE